MKIIKKLQNLVVTASLFSAAVVSTNVHAERLSYASIYPPGEMTQKVMNVFADKVEDYSQGDLSVRVFPMSLLNGAEMSDGLRDGMTDLGFIVTAYFPAQYPYANFLNESSLQMQLFDTEKTENGKGPMAFAGALSELNFMHCPECIGEYAKQNQVYTGGQTTTEYGLACNKPVTTLEDVQGTRIRTGGTHWARWTESLGGQPMSLTVSEILEALDQGILDCAAVAMSELSNFNLWDVVTHFTISSPGGYSAGGNGAAVNADVWRNLSQKDRTALLRASADMSAMFVMHYVNKDREVLEKIKTEGIEIHEPSPLLAAASREFAEKNLQIIVQKYAEQHGIQNGQELLDKFKPLLDRWLELVADVETTEELGQLYWDEVHSKVDTNKYAL